jgi:hypothetical protein
MFKSLPLMWGIIICPIVSVVVLSLWDFSSGVWIFSTGWNLFALFMGFIVEVLLLELFIVKSNWRGEGSYD